MTAATASIELGTTVAYTDARDHLKTALVIGTSESTGGRIPEDIVSLTVFSPMSGNSYHRMARWDEDKNTFVNRDS